MGYWKGKVLTFDRKCIDTGEKTNPDIWDQMTKDKLNIYNIQNTTSKKNHPVYKQYLIWMEYEIC